VAAGVDTSWLDEIAATMPAELLLDAIHWVSYALDTEQLMVEIEDATDRISALVGAARQYSQLDRAPHQDIDVRDELVSTLVMLGHKIRESGRISVVKELAPDLPTIPAHPAELNQVWTNLIDNAIHAMPPFFTTKPVGEGTGLGLDISYRVVTQRHGGDLRVLSRPGDTRFQVRLPLAEPPALG